MTLLRASGESFGASRGASWQPFAALRSALVVSWEPLGSLLETLGGLLGPAWGSRAPSRKKDGAFWAARGTPKSVPRPKKSTKRRQEAPKKPLRALLGRRFGQTLLEQSDDTLFDNPLVTVFHYFCSKFVDFSIDLEIRFLIQLTSASDAKIKTRFVRDMRFTS